MNTKMRRPEEPVKVKSERLSEESKENHPPEESEEGAIGGQTEQKSKRRSEEEMEKSTEISKKVKVFETSHFL